MADYKPAFTAEYKTIIRESHLDTFGHVNNAAYLTLFEEARWEFITERGYGLERVQQLRQGPTILEVKLQFLRELANRNRITIRSWATGQSRMVATMRQVIVKENGEEACVADFTFAFFDLSTRRAIPPTEEWCLAIGISPIPPTPLEGK